MCVFSMIALRWSYSCVVGTASVPGITSYNKRHDCPCPRSECGTLDHQSTFGGRKGRGEGEGEGRGKMMHTCATIVSYTHYSSTCVSDL